MKRKELGNIGENIAAEYLKAHGFKLVKRNFSCRIGEIDIIAKKSGDLYFIEVKTRRNDRFGSPFESITVKKQQKIVKITKYYLLKLKKELNLHFSVIGVTFNDLDSPKIEFLEDAFQVT